MEVGYTRRWLQHFVVTDNLIVTAADFGTFGVTAPPDSRLPDGGGYPVSGLYDVNLAFGGQFNNLLTFNDLLPENPRQYQHYDGITLDFSARPRNGLLFQGGINTGKTVTDNCEVRTRLPEVAPLNPYCHNEPGFITRWTGLMSYTIPRIDVSVSGTIRSDQGAPLQANWNAPLSAIVPSLGRPLSANQQFATVNLVAPGEVWGDRVNEVDIRIGKIVRIGRYANEYRPGCVQRVQLRRGPDLQPGVRSRRPVAGAAVGAHAQVRQDRRANQLLSARTNRGHRSLLRSRRMKPLLIASATTAVRPCSANFE